MSPVPSIKLNSGHSIPQLGLGVYLTSKDTAAKVVQEALEEGYRHVDSAAIYGNEVESAQGIIDFLNSDKAKKTSTTRADIFFTTKIWEVNHGYDKTKAAIEESFQRVKDLKYIDLLLIHSPRVQVPEGLSATESAAERKKIRLGTWKALQEAVEQGIVKSIGISNYGIAHIQELLSWDGLKIKPSVNQIELHPWLQRTELVEFGRKHGIAAEAYSPLTRGQKLKDPQLAALAEKYNKTPAQILVRWSVQKGFITLPKSVHRDRIIENYSVWDFEITQSDLDLLGGKNLNGVTGWDPTIDP